MLEEWLQWEPGDERGSTKTASKEELRGALDKAGLATTASSIMNCTHSELSEQTHARLYQELASHSSTWKEIGTYLGFHQSELDEIQARPLLLNTAPKSWLSAMLAEWLQWEPGDERGSTKTASKEELRGALDKAGLATTASSIMNCTHSELSEQTHARLYQELASHSSTWKEIGTYLGFHQSELEEIQARPLLLTTAPKSWLSAMLAEWLKWAPGDKRGSTKAASVKELSDALDKAGLAATAQSILACTIQESSSL